MRGELLSQQTWQLELGELSSTTEESYVQEVGIGFSSFRTSASSVFYARKHDSYSTLYDVARFQLHSSQRYVASGCAKICPLLRRSREDKSRRNPGKSTNLMENDA